MFGDTFNPGNPVATKTELVLFDNFKNEGIFLLALSKLAFNLVKLTPVLSLLDAIKFKNEPLVPLVKLNVSIVPADWRPKGLLVLELIVLPNIDLVLVLNPKSAVFLISIVGIVVLL
jgi:hypothetical protein